MMSKLFFASGLAFLICLKVPALPAAEPEKQLSFDSEVVPILTRLGCNAGACHGAAAGRGGLRLSLFGSNPDDDYFALARELKGRRICVTRPDESLLLRKPSEDIAHGGGYVLEHDSKAFDTLRTWISQGAQLGKRRNLQELVVRPLQVKMNSTAETQSLEIRARYSDGLSLNVANWTQLIPLDADALKVNEKTASIRATRPGRHIVLARFVDQVVPIEVILPFAKPSSTKDAVPEFNFVDREINESLLELGLAISPQIDDAAYLRRVSLDLIGRLPTDVQLQAFLSDESLDKRAMLVDRLLSSDEFVEFWTYRIAKLLRLAPFQGDMASATVYRNWISQSIRDGIGYDSLARQLLVATGKTTREGATNFLKTYADPREQTELITEVLMGTRLRCANCHNHPLDRWTQDDYHGLSAIFAKIRVTDEVLPNPLGTLVHPRTLDTVITKLPGEREPREGLTRNDFAAWLLEEDNPFFAKAIVNRLWKSMLGRGLVEPVDDFRASNPPSHPELLDQLAEDFVSNQYSIKHLLKTIALSAVYARSSEPLPGNRNDNTFYSHIPSRTLEAEVLADAIADVLGLPERYGNQPAGTRAINLVNRQTPSRSLDVLGRCTDSKSCEADVNSTDGLVRMLHYLNGGILNERIGDERSRISQWLQEERQVEEITKLLYQRAYSRDPTKEESILWKDMLGSDYSKEELKSFVFDLAWAVLSSKEFSSNH